MAAGLLVSSSSSEKLELEGSRRCARGFRGGLSGRRTVLSPPVGVSISMLVGMIRGQCESRVVGEGTQGNCIARTDRIT